MSLTSSRPQPVYPCSQQDLYTIAETGWNSYLAHQAQFENLSTRYTTTVGTDALAAIEAARNMPDEDSRDEMHKTLRVHLVSLSEACIIKWSNMMTFVRDGFPKNEYENKRLAAGYNYYIPAEKEDWDAVKGLMQSGLLFLNANTTVLTDDGGMPATFATEFVAAKTAFEQKHQAFLQAEEESKVLTDAKIEANNALYRALMNMFEDGKKVFRNNAAVREQFTFERIWELVDGSGGGSNAVPATVIEINAYMYDEDTNLPIVGGFLTVMNPPSGIAQTAVSSDEGILLLRITGFAANSTQLLLFEMHKEGYEHISGELDMTSGNAYSVDIPMTPVVEP